MFRANQSALIIGEAIKNKNKDIFFLDFLKSLKIIIRPKVSVSL
tara:strand:- start:129 stop:260 length:132 start_codon:yes stop_codon:yes gene_type:complete